MAEFNECWCCKSAERGWWSYVPEGMGGKAIEGLCSHCLKDDELMKLVGTPGNLRYPKGPHEGCRRA